MAAKPFILATLRAKRKADCTMKYTYKFLDGAENEVEVSPELLAVLNELDDKEEKNNRKETRWHNSMHQLAEIGVEFGDPTQDIEFVLERNAFYKQELRLEHIQRQVFRKHLTEQQAEVFYRHKILKYNNSKIARQLNVTEGAVRKLLEKAKTKLTAIIIECFETDAEFTFDDLEFDDTLFLQDLLSV